MPTMEGRTGQPPSAYVFDVDINIYWARFEEDGSLGLYSWDGERIHTSSTTVMIESDIEQIWNKQ